MGPHVFSAKALSSVHREQCLEQSLGQEAEPVSMVTDGGLILG